MRQTSEQFHGIVCGTIVDHYHVFAIPQCFVNNARQSGRIVIRWNNYADIVSFRHKVIRVIIVSPSRISVLTRHS